MFCPKCGSSVGENARFCEKCGAGLRAGVNSSTNPMNSTTVGEKSSVPKALKIGLPVGLGVVAVALIVVLIFVINGSSGESSETVPVAEQSAGGSENTGGAGQNQSGGENIATSEAPTATPEATPSPEPTPTPIPEPAELSRSDCMALCDEIYNTGSSNNSRKKELMAMSNTILNYMYDKEDVLLTDLSDEELAWVQIYTLCGLYLEDRLIIEPLSTFDFWHTFDKEEVLDYWYHFFGRDPEKPVFIYDLNKDKLVEQKGDTVKFEWEEGEALAGFYKDSSVHVYENDSYYLVTGQDEINCTTDKPLYAQILIYKDEWELPGTVVYARHCQLDKIPIRSIKASSNLPRHKGKTYVAANMIDGKRKTAWCENSNGVGRGETIHLSLVNEARIHGIAIMNGYHESDDLYKANGKVKRISVKTDKGDCSEYKVDNLYKSGWYMNLGQYTYVYFDQPLEASELTIEILDADSGKKYADTCISELKLF